MTTQSVFMVLLFTMILYVSFFDVRRIVRDHTPPAAAESTK
jgi:regulator of sigma E protease